MVSASNLMFTSEEWVDLPPGDYDVYLLQSALAEGVTEQDVLLRTSIVTPRVAGNFTVAPASQPAVPGARAKPTIGWSGLTAGQRYLGVIEYGQGSTPLDTTIVRVRG